MDRIHVEHILKPMLSLWVCVGSCMYQSFFHDTTDFHEDIVRDLQPALQAPRVSAARGVSVGAAQHAIVRVREAIYTSSDMFFGDF